MTEKDVLVSIVIPVLNESSGIEKTLQSLQYVRELACELIVVDGGSTDDTFSRAQPLVDCCLLSPPGRARQMNLAAARASGQWLLFLHADTRLPEDFSAYIQRLLSSNYYWGFFKLRLNGGHFLFRIIERAINIRSAFSRVATGDQLLFCRRAVFEEIGGFDNIPLMEDIAFSKALRKKYQSFIWNTPVVTSSRRWEQGGIIKTVFLMWCLRLAYFLGVSPQRLHRFYYG
jgi:rSAM/selenodomain-associated transferase 2